MKSSLELLKSLHHYHSSQLQDQLQGQQCPLCDEAEESPLSLDFRPMSHSLEERDNGFLLTLGTRGRLSPEELSVRQVGGRLQESGLKEEMTWDAGNEDCCHLCCVQELRQEIELPKVGDFEALNCSMLDVKLYIEVAKKLQGKRKKQDVGRPNRQMSPDYSQAVKMPAYHSSKTQDCTTGTQHTG